MSVLDLGVCDGGRGPTVYVPLSEEAVGVARLAVCGLPWPVVSPGSGVCTQVNYLNSSLLLYHNMPRVILAVGAIRGMDWLPLDACLYAYLWSTYWCAYLQVVAQGRYVVASVSPRVVVRQR